MAPWRILQSRYKGMVLEQSREDGSIVAYRQDLHSSFPSVSNIESRNFCIFQNRNLSQPQAGGPPLVSCTRLLIQYVRSYPPYWRPFLHPQPEDAPICGEWDPLITGIIIIIIIIIIITIIGPSLIWFLYI